MNCPECSAVVKKLYNKSKSYCEAAAVYVCADCYIANLSNSLDRSPNTKEDPIPEPKEEWEV